MHPSCLTFRSKRHPRQITGLGELISTSFVASTVNLLISKRFCKKQQMQWTPEGAHLLLQTRAQTLDGALRGTFEKW